MTTFGKYFFGNLISEYGRKNGRVDYATLAKSFDAVLNNNICSTMDGAWEMVHGFIDNSEDIDKLADKVAELEQALDEIGEIMETHHDKELDAEYNEKEAERNALLDEIADLESDEERMPEIFQFYIISDNGAQILEEYTNEIIFYNEELDMYVWGVTHYGTGWDYVLTDIPCEVDEDAKA